MARDGHAEDWFMKLVGQNGSNVGMGRFLAAVAVFILVFGTIMWAIWPG